MRKGHNLFRGTGVAIVTPFKRSGAIDFDSFEKIIEHIVNGGVNYIVLLGTTGESATLSKQEKKTLIKFTVKVLNGRIPLVIGMGGNDTNEIVLSIHATPFQGVDGILSVCPYYNKPQQEGIYQHFKTIAEASPVPVILYTVPGRTGSNISASTTLRLARDCDNIAGIKEASGNLDQIFQVITHRPEGFLVISGDDALTLPLIASGADGVISVTANAYPSKVAGIVENTMAGKLKEAQLLHYQLLEFTNSLFADGSPSGIKAALEIKKLCENFVRLPLVPVSDEAYSRIHKAIKKLKQ